MATPVREVGADLPFGIRDLRAAIPDRCLRRSALRSLCYLALDLAGLAALYVLPLRIEGEWIWPFVAFAQGTLFWALFVIGHDCGHGSFSDHRWLNDAVGHLVHTPLLVPYHGWKVSHRLHHRFAGHADRDEAWHPLTESQYRCLPWYTRLLRYGLPLLVFPLYLLRRTPGRRGSHFHPGSEMFGPRDRARVLVSSLLCAGMLAALLGAAIGLGPGAVARQYLAPYLVFVCWLDLVTILHHTAPDVPWYRDRTWSFLRGALSTMDRRYGWLERLHHHAGHHVAHHLFPRIPHYHLAEATRAIRPVLGVHYREATGSIARSLLVAVRSCRFVPDEGDIVHFRAPRTDQLPQEPLAFGGRRGAGSRPAIR